MVGIGASFFNPPNLNITGKPEVLKSGESESGIIQHSLHAMQSLFSLQWLYGSVVLALDA